MKGKVGLIRDVCLALDLTVAGGLLRVMPGSTSTTKSSADSSLVQL